MNRFPKFTKEHETCSANIERLDSLINTLAYEQVVKFDDKFTDPTFPPDRTSIIWDKYIGNDLEMKNEYEQLSDDGIWKRIPDISIVKNPSLWGYNGIKPGGVI